MLWHTFQILTFSTIFYFLLLTLAIAASPAKEQNGSHHSPGTLPEKLSTSLPLVSDFQISESQTKQLQHLPYLYPGLSNSNTYTFTSKTPVSKNHARNTYLQFTLTVLNYNIPSSAKTASDILLASSNPDTGLSYAWDYVVTTSVSVYWLHAPCLMSNQHWQQLTNQLLQYVFVDSPQQHSAFACRCGQKCLQIEKK